MIVESQITCHLTKTIAFGQNKRRDLEKPNLMRTFALIGKIVYFNA